MKLVLIADNHGLKPKLPKGDVLVCAGDLTMNGSLVELEHVTDWLKHQPHKVKIAIAGNHDFCFENPVKAPHARKLMEEAGVIYLQDQEVTIDGVKFYGAPWQPWFGGWAFNYHAEEAEAIWKKVPQDTDVLITHGPPYLFLDKVYKEHVGCNELLKVVERVIPQVHVFGHIHCAYGFFNAAPHLTKFFNAALVNEKYELANEPFVTHVEKRKQ